MHSKTNYRLEEGYYGMQGPAQVGSGHCSLDLVGWRSIRMSPRSAHVTAASIRLTVASG